MYIYFAPNFRVDFLTGCLLILPLRITCQLAEMTELAQLAKLADLAELAELAETILLLISEWAF